MLFPHFGSNPTSAACFANSQGNLHSVSCPDINHEQLRIVAAQWRKTTAPLESLRTQRGR